MLRQGLSPARDDLGAFDRHASEQYFTCSQSRSHFLRQTNGRPQVRQVLDGNSDFLRMRGMFDSRVTSEQLQRARRRPAFPANVRSPVGNCRTRRGVEPGEVLHL